MNNKHILSEIGKWERESIITPELAGVLKSRYENKNGKKMLTVILAVIGSVLIGAGVILIIASNWNRIPLVPKTILSFLPLIAAQCLGTFTFCKKRDSIIWRESVAVLWAAGVFASLAMIGQSFHLANDLSVYLLTSGVLTLPVVFLLDAGSALAVYFYAVLHGGTLLLIRTESPVALVGLIVLACLGFIYSFRSRGKGSIRALYVKWCSAIAGTALTAIIGVALNDIFSICLLGLLFVCFYASAEKNSGAENPFRFLGVLGTVAITLFTGFLNDWSYNSFSLSDGRGILYLLIYAGFAAYAVIKIIKNLRGSLYQLLFSATGLAVSLSCLIFGLFEVNLGYSGNIIYMVISFALGIGLIVRGTGEGSLKLTNLGLITSFSVIAFWFFEFIGLALESGMLFVFFGAAILIVNVRLIKRNKARTALLNVPTEAEEEM